MQSAARVIAGMLYTGSAGEAVLGAELQVGMSCICDRKLGCQGKATAGVGRCVGRAAVLGDDVQMRQCFGPLM
jgi:hypothetical protein